MCITLKGVIKNNSIIRMLILIVFISCVGLFINGCTMKEKAVLATENKKEIIVFAAASLTESFEEIKKEYEKEHEDIEIIYNFAGSQVLKNQIQSGANPAIFFSANHKYPKELISNGITVNNEKLTEDDILVFAKNKLVVIAGEKQPYNNFDEFIENLNESTATIVVANEQVPVGKYTKSMLETYVKITNNTEVADQFYSHIVSYENDVKAVLAKVKMKEVDYGVVYGTDALSVTESIETIDIPKQYNQVAVYGSLYLEDQKDSKEFYDYIVEGEGQKILVQFGFVTSE